MSLITLAINHPKRKLSKVFIDSQEIQGHSIDKQITVFEHEISEGWHHILIQQCSVLDSKKWWLRPFELIEITNGFFITFVREIGFDGDCACLSFRTRIAEDTTCDVALEKKLQNHFGPFISRYFRYFLIGGNAKYKEIDERLAPTNEYMKRWRVTTLLPKVFILVLFSIIALLAIVLAFESLTLKEWLFFIAGPAVALIELVYSNKKIKEKKNRVDELFYSD